MNPFARTNAGQVAPLLDRDLRLAIPTPGRPLQILGASGAGKTTCLHWLAASAAEQGLGSSYTYIPRERPHPEPPRAGLVLIDEAQRLAWPKILTLLRSSGDCRLAVASHLDLRPWTLLLGVRLDTVLLHPLRRYEIAAYVRRRWPVGADALATGVLDLLAHLSRGNPERLEDLCYFLYEADPTPHTLTAGVIRAVAAGLQAVKGSSAAER